MREILFRGKCVDCGEWIEGYYVCLPLVNYNRKEYLITIAETGASWEIIPETVGQWTGFTDKNGKKIFEGDLICVSNLVWLVAFEKGAFVCKDEEYKTYFDFYEHKHFDDYEIIGNIHDNPELINKM